MWKIKNKMNPDNDSVGMKYMMREVFLSVEACTVSTWDFTAVKGQFHHHGCKRMVQKNLFFQKRFSEAGTRMMIKSSCTRA